MPKKTTKYNFILKEFTKLNNKLPEDRKLSIRDRRKIIKEVLLPSLQDVPKYKIKVKALKSSILAEIENLPPKEICDLNYIDVGSEYALIEWFSLDETISELVPDCVYVKVSAGEFGETRIFNTRDYQYGRNGVRKIVEAIRPDAENTSGKYLFSGYRKLRPKKRNDGTPENYYLDFVLFIVDTRGNQTALAEDKSVYFELPRTKEVRKKKTKIKNIIETKIKKLKSKRDSKRRASKTLDTNIKKFNKISKQLNKAKTPSKATQLKSQQQLAHTIALLEKYYKEGKITKWKYDTAIEKIFKEFNK